MAGDSRIGMSVIAHPGEVELRMFAADDESVCATVTLSPSVALRLNQLISAAIEEATR